MTAAQSMPQCLAAAPPSSEYTGNNQPDCRIMILKLLIFH